MNLAIGAKRRLRDRRWKVYNTTKGLLLCSNAILADTFCRRGLGLLFRKDWSGLDGLLLVPCASIHTFGMRMELDVCFLDSRMKVLDVRHDFGPWKLARGGAEVSCTLELPAGRIKETGTQAGDFLCLQKSAEGSGPEQLDAPERRRTCDRR